MNPDELAALCLRVWQEPQWIQVQCPRGHFLRAVTLIALPASHPDGPLLLMSGASGHQHVPRLGQRLYDYGAFALTNDVHGTVTLVCKRCPRWTPERDYQRLAAELAVYALAGHREHRLR